MSRRLNIVDIRKSFSAKGYTLLTTEYKSNKQKLEYICPKGHNGTIAWCSWDKGHKCAECAGCKKKDINFIRQEFDKEEYQLLTTEYKNSRQKLEYICPKGHKGTITWGSWQKGARCLLCGLEMSKEKRKTDISIIQKSFEEKGYKLLTTEYKSNRQKLEYICVKGHKGSISWDSWVQGHACKQCAIENSIIKRKLDAQTLYVSIHNLGYELLSEYKEYKNGKSLLKLKCKKGHTFTSRWNDLSQGHGCPICACVGSKPETELFDLIKKQFPDAIHNDRKVIAPFELDIVIPSKKIAIEYCGIYWHSELHGKDKNYHLNKLNKAKEQGYRLITIFEDEYLNRKEVVFDRLNSILGMSKAIKINARDCIVKEIDTKIAREFCDKYHLQGYGNSKVKLGAYLNDELLSVMTFSKPSVAKGTKFSNDDTYELNRFCSKINYNIRGIASKLLTHFNRTHKPSLIISYADKRWSDGDLYKALGFSHLHDSEPNYWYLEQQKRVHRFNFRKNILKDKLEKFNEAISEWQNMINNGYDRIWDCGNMKFVLNFA